MSEESYILEIEQSVIGAFLMASADGAKEALTMVDEKHFIHPFNKHIFAAIVTSVEKYNSPKITVVKKLIDDEAAEKFSLSEKITVSEYLSKCVATTLGFGHIPALIAQWARLSVMREAEIIAAAAASPNADIGPVLQEFSANIDDVMSEVRGGTAGNGIISLADAAGIAIDSAEEASRREDGLTGASWGLNDINRITGGIQAKELTLIGARPSMGKSAVAMSVARMCAISGRNICFISLEMDAKKLAARVISDSLYDRDVEIAYNDIIRGALSQKQFEIVREEEIVLSKLPITIDEKMDQTITDIRSRAERLIAKSEEEGNRLSVLMIDHLSLINASRRYSGNRVNEVAEITAGLKAIARDLDIAVVLLSQLSRGVESRENKRPMLSDLRDSGSIEQDADFIAFLYREEYYLERKGELSLDEQSQLDDCRNKMEFIIAKNRNGETSTVHLFANMAYSAIRDLSRL